jgi:hypothetical protein
VRRSLRAWLLFALVLGAGIAAGLALPSERQPAKAPRSVSYSLELVGSCLEGARDCTDESSGLVDSSGQAP